MAVVRNGDEIELDGPNRTLSLLISDAELQARLADWRASRGAASATRGYVRLYTEHVLQADKGCDLDFLVGGSGADVARESH